MTSPTGTRTTTATKAAGGVALVAAVWLGASAWILGYDDVSRAAVVQVVAALVLAALGFLLLRGLGGRLASIAVVWTGLFVAVLPVAMRYGYFDRAWAAYVNGIVVGVVLIAVGVWSAKSVSK